MLNGTFSCQLAQLSDTLEAVTPVNKVTRNEHSAELAQLAGSFEDEEHNVWKPMLVLFAVDERSPTPPIACKKRMCERWLCPDISHSVCKNGTESPRKPVEWRDYIYRLRLSQDRKLCPLHVATGDAWSCWHRRRCGLEGRIRREHGGWLDGLGLGFIQQHQQQQQQQQLNNSTVQHQQQQFNNNRKKFNNNSNNNNNSTTNSNNSTTQQQQQLNNSNNSTTATTQQLQKQQPIQQLQQQQELNNCNNSNNSTTATTATIQQLQQQQ